MLLLLLLLLLLVVLLLLLRRIVTMLTLSLIILRLLGLCSIAILLPDGMVILAVPYKIFACGEAMSAGSERTKMIRASYS